jgi:hypothetical protein
MNGNLGPMTAILSILGVCLGALAIVITVEVAKRCLARLELHKLDINVHVSERIRQQDQDLRTMISNATAMMDEMERKTENQLGQIRALGQELNTRICRQDAQFDANLAAYRETVIQLEQSCQAHDDQLAEVKIAVGMMARKAKEPKSGAPGPVTHS